MRSNLRVLMSTVGVVMVAALVGLLVTGRDPVYGQGPPLGTRPVVDLTGVWEGEFSGYLFEDVLDEYDSPQFIFQEPGEDLVITDQTDSTFAGSWPGGDKVTGTVMPDGTVTVQMFEPGELRLFGTGTVEVRGNRAEIHGVLHAFDDFGFGGDTSMFSGVFRFVKVN